MSRGVDGKKEEKRLAVIAKSRFTGLNRVKQTSRVIGLQGATKNHRLAARQSTENPVARSRKSPCSSIKGQGKKVWVEAACWVGLTLAMQLSLRVETRRLLRGLEDVFSVSPLFPLATCFILNANSDSQIVRLFAPCALFNLDPFSAGTPYNFLFSSTHL